ncbi:hypothetical protein PWG15_09625 [Ensifer adhaerens]|uniref:hypothetical protein n=1 Tax=Ensifer adhaerens TaxID=106592 RepID=UPI0023A98D7B|nr:hypothetical protein [Ensifer adhaerens]WDZ78723.1 hypothetical protein PWG15_09625 [Ensifer adhaerens]
MEGTNSGTRYARAWGTAVGLFAGAIAAFSFVAPTFARLLGASGEAETTALVVMLAAWAIPAAYIILAAWLAKISAARAKALGMPAAIGVCIALLALANFPVSIATGALRSTDFAAGLLGKTLMPHAMIGAVIALATLSQLPAARKPRTGHHAVAYVLWHSLLVFLTAMGLGIVVCQIWLLALGFHGLIVLWSLVRALIYMEHVTLYPMLPLALFFAASIYFVWSNRNQSSASADAVQAKAGAEGVSQRE